MLKLLLSVRRTGPPVVVQQTPAHNDKSVIRYILWNLAVPVSALPALQSLEIWQLPTSQTNTTQRAMRLMAMRYHCTRHRYHRLSSDTTNGMTDNTMLLEKGDMHFPMMSKKKKDLKFSMP